MSCMSQRKAIASGCLPMGKIPTSQSQFAKGGMVKKGSSTKCK